MIRLFVADSSQRILDNITKRIGREEDISVVGTAQDGETAIQECLRVQPDIAVLDASLPSADGIAVTELLAQYLPSMGVILMSMDVEQDLMRKAMRVGARECLAKPFRGDELVAAIHRVYDMEQKKAEQQQPAAAKEQPAAPVQQGLVSLFLSAKGGVGRTTLATNIAVALGAQNAKVCIVDLCLQFGDVAAHLSLVQSRTLYDLAFNEAVSDIEAVNQAIAQGHGISAILAPSRPEEADVVSTAHVRALLEVLKGSYDHIVLDGPSHLNELALEALDVADNVIVVTDYSMTSIKSTKSLLQVLSRLKVPKDKVLIVSNERDSVKSLDAAAIAAHLSWDRVLPIPHDAHLVNDSILNAQPLTLGAPTRDVAVAMMYVAKDIAPGLFVDGAETVDPALSDPRRRKQRRLLGFSRT